MKHNRRSTFSNVLVFQTSGDISSKIEAFLILIFVSTPSSSSYVNCPCLMSSWILIIFSAGLSRISEKLPSWCFKCSFHLWSLYSWLAAFVFTHVVIFLLLISFTVCYANRDCLFSSEFLISLIWTWVYFSYSSWYDCSLRTFLSFCILAFVGFFIK